MELTTRPERRISGLRIAPRLMDDGASLVRVKVNCNNSGSSCETALTVNIHPHNFDGPPITREYPVNLPAGENMVEKTIMVEDPKLWWTWDHGDQNLYRCQVKLKTGTDTDKRSDTFGIREIQMAGKNANSQWKLNGQSFFPRGSNIISTMGGRQIGMNMLFMIFNTIRLLTWRESSWGIHWRSSSKTVNNISTIF